MSGSEARAASPRPHRARTAGSCAALQTGLGPKISKGFSSSAVARTGPRPAPSCSPRTPGVSWDPLRALTPKAPTPTVSRDGRRHFVNELEPAVLLALGGALALQREYPPNPRALEEAFERLRQRMHEAVARGASGETLVGEAPRLREPRPRTTTCDGHALREDAGERC